jgi:hypothetical protein
MAAGHLRQATRLLFRRSNALSLRSALAPHVLRLAKDPRRRKRGSRNQESQPAAPELPAKGTEACQSQVE